MTETAFETTLAAITGFAATADSLEALQRFVVETIPANLHYYHWTGFYMLDPADPAMLLLGPFHGAPTEHTRIPVSEGICGAAVAQEQTIIVDDVTADPRYLACSLETRSEIVVPIRAHSAVVGEIDIDSHAAAAFTAADRDFLEQCAEIVGGFMERIQPISK